eukprot:208599-Amphidinium_carterae.1
MSTATTAMITSFARLAHNTWLGWLGILARASKDLQRSARHTLLCVCVSHRNDHASAFVAEDASVPEVHRVKNPGVRDDLALCVSWQDAIGSKAHN